MVHMLATALSKRLKLKTPIFQAPMAGVTTPELVLAVGKAGALGGFGAAYTEPAALKDAVGKVRAAVPDLPIHINLFVEAPPREPSAQELRAAAAALAPAFESLKVKIPEKLPPPYCPDLSAQIENALALRPAVLSSHFNPFAPEVIKEARKLGILIAGSATTLEEAQRQEALGCDLIIAQGSEAGGHRGTFTGAREVGMIGVLALTRLIVKRTHLPVVAAGGIMDGAGVAAVLALGAQAAQIGTAFIATPESGAPAQHKRALFSMQGQGTVITRAFSGRAARGIRNRFVEQAEKSAGAILPFPAQHKLTVPLRGESNKQGTPDYVALWAGQGYALATEEAAGALVARWTQEAEEMLRSLV
jgi:nitronate monooxygenase